MPVESIELIKLIIGIGIITVPGYFWSYSISKKLTGLERLLFGFLAGIGILTLGSFVANMFLHIDLTRTFLISLFIVYAAPILFLYVLSLYEFGIPKINLKFLKNKKLWLLAGILIFIAFMMFLPHVINNYYLPFHVDEWEHYTYSRTIIESGSISFPNPYTGEGIVLHPEVGFQIATANLYFISDADLPTIFVFMPAILAMFIGLVVFNIGDRAERKFGLEAAFLVAFIPTTVRFMGPSFWVAITLGLLFLLFIIWLGQLKTIQGALLISVFLIILFIIHPPTALAAILIMFLFTIFLAVEKQYKTALYMGIFTLLPLLLLFFLATEWNYTFDMVITALSGKTYLMELPKIWVDFNQLGIITWIFFILGSFYAFAKGKTMVRTLCVAAILFFIIIGAYSRFHFGIPIIYERSFLYLFLLVALIAAVGVSELRKTVTLLTEHHAPPRYKRYAKIFGYFVPIVVALLLLFTAAPAHSQIPYYQMINEEQYTTFTWIHNHITTYQDHDHPYDRAAVDPFIASPFTALTGIHTISTIMSPVYGYNLHLQMETFLNNECRNTSFLEVYQLSVIYGRCNNSNLTMIYPLVYLYPGLYD